MHKAHVTMLQERNWCDNIGTSSSTNQLSFVPWYQSIACLGISDCIPISLTTKHHFSGRTRIKWCLLSLRWYGSTINSILWWSTRTIKDAEYPSPVHIWAYISMLKALSLTITLITLFVMKRHEWRFWMGTMMVFSRSILCCNAKSMKWRVQSSSIRYKISFISINEDNTVQNLSQTEN